MKRSFVGLAAAALFLAGGSAFAAIENGGFEGGLKGWTRTCNVTTKSSTSKLGEKGDWQATEGGSFAYLTSGLGKSVYTLLAQVFTAEADSELSLDVFFDANDRCKNDNGFVSLRSLDTGCSTTLYRSSASAVGGSGSDGWTQLVQSIAKAGTYVLTIGVRNVGDNCRPSAMGVDNVQLHSSVVPEMSGLAVWSLLGACGVGMALRRRRAA